MPVNSEKINLLMHLHLVTRDELNSLRHRQTNIFNWSSYVFIFVIGGLAVVDQSRVPLWANGGLFGKIIASLTLFFMVIFSIQWQQRTRGYQEEVSETLNKIEKSLHCFDKGYFDAKSNNTLYPERWGKPKNYHKRVNFWKRVFRVNYISATVLLGVLAIAMIWLSSN